MVNNIDKFIECVHNRPILWNKSVKDYLDRNCREKAWIEIGEILYENWLEMKFVERDEKVRDMKSKWRNIKDCFQKYIKQGKTVNAPTKKKKKYIYADALMFLLLNTTEKRKTSGNLEEDTDEQVNEETDERLNEETVKRLNEETDEQMNEDAEEYFGKIQNKMELNGTSHPSRTRAQKRKNGNRQRTMSNLTIFQNEMFKKMDDKLKVNPDPDPDKLFLLSILPDYKKLNEDEKIDFRLLTLQFFRDTRRKKNSQTVDYSNQSYPINQLPSSFIINPSYQFHGHPNVQTVPYPVIASATSLVKTSSPMQTPLSAQTFKSNDQVQDAPGNGTTSSENLSPDISYVKFEIEKINDV